MKRGATPPGTKTSENTTGPMLRRTAGATKFAMTSLRRGLNCSEGKGLVVGIVQSAAKDTLAIKITKVRVKILIFPFLKDFSYAALRRFTKSAHSALFSAQSQL